MKHGTFVKAAAGILVFLTLGAPFLSLACTRCGQEAEATVETGTCCCTSGTGDLSIATSLSHECGCGLNQALESMGESDVGDVRGRGAEERGFIPGAGPGGPVSVFRI